MSEPRFYSWDNKGNMYNRNLTGNLQNRLKQILVQCLVTGYENKPGAGWTLGHEHEFGFSLINADGNVVNFVSGVPEHGPYPSMSADSLHIYAAESITDTSNAIIDGANLCSGPYRKGVPEPDSFPRHTVGWASRPLETRLATLQWTLVADDKTFVLNCSSNSSSQTSSSYDDPFTLYVGRVLLDAPVSGNFVALGGMNGNYKSRNNMFAYSQGYTSLRDLSTGLAQYVEVGAQPYMFDRNPYFDDGNTAIPSRINFQQPRVVSGDMYVGRLRGVVYDDLLRSVHGWEVSLRAIGFTGKDYTDRGKPVKIGDYSYAFARSYSGNSFLTDNPEFW